MLAFFNPLTAEALDEPTISYEGLCDILEERNPTAQINPQALCERMNSEARWHSLLIIVSYRPCEDEPGVRRIEKMRAELWGRGLCQELLMQKLWS